MKWLGTDRFFRGWLWALCLLPLIGILLSPYPLSRRLGLVGFSLVAFGSFARARLRLDRTLQANTIWRLPAQIYRFVGFPLDLFMVTQLLAARGSAEGTWMNGPFFMWVGPVWYSAHAIALFAYFFLWLVGRVRKFLPARSMNSSPPVSPGRRKFIEGSIVAAAGVPFAISLSGVGTSYDFQVEEREVYLPGWPRSLDGLRVAHLSDIHVGGAMDAIRLQRVAELTNQARPDIVMHTGDFLTHRDGEFDAPLYPALAQIRAPLGQWACRGNHDFDDPVGFPRKLDDAGVNLLRDEQSIVEVAGEQLRVGGLDYVNPDRDRAALYAAHTRGMGPHDGEPRILLLHDPAQWVHVPTGATNLVLSGHTHGGHIGIPWGQGALWTVVGAAGWPDQGIFTREDDARLYVTRCVGFYGYPLRLGIPPEIALLNLRSA